MKRKNPSTKNIFKREPFIAGFILPVLILAAFAPTLLFQTNGDAGDPVFVGDQAQNTPPSSTETAEQKLTRMLNAFDHPSMVPGTLIVNFENGTTLAQANIILQALNLRIDEKQVCTNGQAVNPDGTTSPNTENCFSDGWFSSITAGRVLVSVGDEKTIAQQVYNTPGIVWVEPDYMASIGSDSGNSLGVESGDNTSNPLVNNPAANPSVQPPANIPTNTILGIEPLLLVVGLVVVGFGAYFAMGKKN